ncbi:MAG: heparinase II/III family protein [Opitutales bacterium]
MQALFDRLNLAHPGLETVQAATAHRDWDGAGAALLDHFLRLRPQRCLEFWDLSGPEDYPPMPWRAASTPEQLWKNTPERVLEGKLYASGHIFDFARDADIDWASDVRLWADGKTYPFAQARCMLRRLYWLRVLDLAYLRGDAATRNRAAAQFARLMQSWLDQWVEEEFAVNHAIALADVISQSGLMRSWFIFLPAPQVSTELKLRLLLHLAEGADDVLARAQWHPWIWGLSEASGMGLTGILLPELREAAAWRNRCFEYANRFFQTELRPDGTLKRMHFCPHYTGGTAIWPLAFYPQIARLGYRDLLEPAARAGVEHIVDWIAAVQKPDNTVPQITASDLQGFGRWLAAGAEEFNRPDWLYVATAGRAGRAPAGTSRILPDAGAFCLRDGFTRDAMVACFHNGDFHNLERTSLAVDLYALGRTLVTAPGRYGYYHPEFLPYFASAGYNSLFVDAAPQQVWGEHPLRAGTGLADANWRLGSDFDWAWGSHPAGFDNAPDVRWQRGLLFVKANYWLVIDRIHGPGEHNYSLRWLLTPGEAEIEADGLGVHTRNADANVLLRPALPADARLDLWSGQREPLRGWFSPENGTMVPAPQLEYTWHGALPALTATLIVPYRQNRPTHAVAIRATTPDCHDVVVTRPDGEDCLTLDFRGPGLARLTRCHAGGVTSAVDFTAGP